MEELLKGNEDVIDLLAYNPFHDGRPKYVRTAVYKYEIPSRDECEGRWWNISGPVALISTQSEALVF